MVDDDSIVCDALGVSLADDGYQVRLDADARRVREVVRDFRPDLAILDLHLAEGPDGRATARTLKKAGRVGVMFLTEADSLEDRLSGFHAGADDYMVKPF